MSTAVVDIASKYSEKVPDDSTNNAAGAARRDFRSAGREEEPTNYRHYQQPS